jgi:hypothetical protein
VRKPGAFARYRYREEMFPSLVFRRAHDALRSWYGERADVEYVRILHLAASTREAEVEAALAQCLAQLPQFEGSNRGASRGFPQKLALHFSTQAAGDTQTLWKP